MNEESPYDVGTFPGVDTLVYLTKKEKKAYQDKMEFQECISRIHATMRGTIYNGPAPIIHAYGGGTWMSLLDACKREPEWEEGGRHSRITTDIGLANKWGRCKRDMRAYVEKNRIAAEKAAGSNVYNAENNHERKEHGGCMNDENVDNESKDGLHRNAIVGNMDTRNAIEAEPVDEVEAIAVFKTSRGEEIFKFTPRQFIFRANESGTSVISFLGCLDTEQTARFMSRNGGEKETIINDYIQLS